MDFKQLMNLASQNKAQTKKQETQFVTAKSSDSKSNKTGISEEAVKAFLAKKELEKKKKAAEEEAARRARIEERLVHSLGTKNKGSVKDASCRQKQKQPSDLSRTTEKHPDRNNEKQKVSKHRDVKTTHQPTSKKPDTDQARHSVEHGSKNGDYASQKSSHKGQRNITKGGTVPVNFKALLAMAERNKNGGFKLPPVSGHETSMKQDGNKLGEGKLKKSHLEQNKVVNRGQDKTVMNAKTSRQTHPKPVSSKLQVKEVTSKASSSFGNCNANQDLKRPEKLANGTRDKELASKASSALATSAKQGKLWNSNATCPSNYRHSVNEAHLRHRGNRDSLKRKRKPYRNEVDDMDDFIDDGDGEDVDVSKYIKEIFGYDRSRFRDDSDDDLAGMESNYSQIEREEVKSAKIARLEDEIEQLKELHELKKQRDKLKKTKK